MNDQEQQLAGTPAAGTPDGQETPAEGTSEVEETQDPTLPESPFSDVPAEDACSECEGTGLIGDPALPGNKVCEQCEGTGRK